MTELIVQVLGYLGGHFMETLVLISFVALFFKETLSEYMRLKLGKGPSDAERRTLEMANNMSELKMHFNDETTHILTDIQVMMAKGAEDTRQFRETQLTQCGKLDEIRDSLRDIARNGIRIRK